MGPRNLLILFFSTVAFSLVILVIFFSLFFKNVDLNFNTRLPQSAPDIGGTQYTDSTAPAMNPDSKASGTMRSTVNVPPELSEPPAPVSNNTGTAHKGKAVPDSQLPPTSDDNALDNEKPLTEEALPAMDSPPPAPVKIPERTNTTAPGSKPASPSVGPAASGYNNIPSQPANPLPPTPRHVERAVHPRPMPSSAPTPDSSPAQDNSGPPIPGQ